MLQQFYIRSLGSASFTAKKHTFCIPESLKVIKPGKHYVPLIFEEFPSNKKFCIVNYIDKYNRRKSLLRKYQPEKSKQLLLSYAASYKSLTSGTLASYIKTFLGLAGIDVTVLKAHSTRHTSTNKALANNIGLSIEDIRNSAGGGPGKVWSYNCAKSLTQTLNVCILRINILFLHFYT